MLADAGVGSRRACEELIEEGRVEVDGAVVRTQGMRVDPERAVVKVDGMRVVTAPERAYLALNKPRGVLTTMQDDRGRPCVGDLVAQRGGRLFHVGRLDADTEGLLLLTNDGDLAHRLMHPSHGVRKVYLADVTGTVSRDELRALRSGVELDDGPARADAVRIVGNGAGRTLLELELHEGRNRIVRRMCDAIGHPVQQLVRTHVGPVSLGSLKPGRSRRLTAAEVGGLFAAVEDIPIS
ncbi:MAG TPA: pseudouridine synthase [Mycobacteriales bacterium]|nr:pseudouridine synthase [Mycobacteriales bacterium]